MGCLESTVHTEIVICFPLRGCDCMLRECQLTLVICLQGHSVLTVTAVDQDRAIPNKVTYNITNCKSNYVTREITLKLYFTRTVV